MRALRALVAIVAVAAFLAPLPPSSAAPAGVSPPPDFDGGRLRRSITVNGT